MVTGEDNIPADFVQKMRVCANTVVTFRRPQE